MNKRIDEWAEFATALAHESGELILRYFGTPLDVQRKADQSPVTAADRGAEALLRARIEKKYPGHQVLGEEEGKSGAEGAALQWVLDPIDGTKAFVRGVPLFGTLIGLLEEGTPILGVIHLPATRQLLLGAQGRPTTLNGKVVRVSDVDSLDRASVMLTCPATLLNEGFGSAFDVLRRKAELIRGWGDCYGHFLVATGQADIMLDPVMNLWDIAALKPCVEGAGGRLTDFAGESERLGASALSTNGRLHDSVLKLLQDGK